MQVRWDGGLKNECKNKRVLEAKRSGGDDRVIKI